MKVWFSSDLHFGHKRVIEFCNRPFMDVEQMDRELIFKHNDLVAPNDLVYHLGDISFHSPQRGIPLIKKMNGRKILIQGNHDKYSATQYDEVYIAVAREMRIVLGGKHFCLSHYPYFPSPYEGADPLALRYQDRRPVERPGTILLCGHVHNAWKERCIEMGETKTAHQVNVGVDVWDYKPVSISQILSLLCKE